MRVVDLFAGCGGMSLGFSQAGFQVAAAYDSWQLAVDVYNSNFDNPAYVADLGNPETVLEEVRGLDADMIIGGPPCQDFSHAGRRSEGDRATLTMSFADIIKSIRPEWFVMENVDRALSSNAYRVARETFIANGYGITERVLDASLCGVPQRRKRLFVVGRLNDQNGFLDALIDMRMSEVPMTLREYLGRELSIDHYYRHPRNYERRAIFSLDEPAATVRGVNRPIPPNYKGHANDTADYNGLRPLTTMERARVQTFPPNFAWKGNKTEMEQMIGNAVPVGLAAFVAGCIRDYQSANIVLDLNREGGHDRQRTIYNLPGN
jgi:DNA (cytosine-5)-methyltransferase 1